MHGFGLFADFAGLGGVGVGGVEGFEGEVFEGDEGWEAESNYQKQEKYCIDHQPTDIKHLLVDFEKCDQLVVIHRHAESKVDPVCGAELSRLGPHLCQLYSEVDVLDGEDSNQLPKHLSHKQHNTHNTIPPHLLHHQVHDTPLKPDHPRLQSLAILLSQVFL